jgi:hypothetical protein
MAFAADARKDGILGKRIGFMGVVAAANVRRLVGVRVFGGAVGDQCGTGGRG